MTKKIFLIIFIFFFCSSHAQEAIQAHIKYTEATARVEAFSNVEKKINKDFYKDYLKDLNRKENIESMKNKIFYTGGRFLCPFYINNSLISYAITYEDREENNFYYNTLGNLIKFDIISNGDYPKKILGYSRFGNLISVTFEADEFEQFVYDENGKLQAHWINSEALNKNSDMPKFIKLKRGDI